MFLESYYFDEPKIGVIAAILIILYTQKLKHDHDFDRFQRAVRYQSGIHFVME
ncbi:MAG: hypothetical protein LBJ93_02675 [Clostridiales bacterium]|nr:hypothetical protein [Clostridiales bacterium]